MKQNVYETINAQIIADLAQGRIPWEKAWSTATEGCYSYTTGKPYSLLNTLLLGADSGEYLTFNAARKAGGFVRKGEKARTVVFWSIIEKEDKDSGETRKIPFLRSYSVFNRTQCDGVPAHKDFTRATYNTDPIEAAERVMREYVAREGITLENAESNEAFYRPSTDTVHLPNRNQYADPREYYATAFHELAHSTGAKNRLNRAEEGHDAYGREELVAEMAAAYLMNLCGIDTASTLRHHEGYLQGWMRAINADTRLLVSAATRAQHAVERILGATAPTAEEDAE